MNSHDDINKQKENVMAYLGEIDLAKIAPNHPFAGIFIGFGNRPRGISIGESPTGNTASKVPKLTEVTEPEVVKPPRRKLKRKNKGISP